MVSLTEMEAFVAVVEAGGFSAAARALHLAPPVVSKRLAKLEQDLGVRLIQRTTRRLITTDLGQAYYERAAVIVKAAQEAQQFVRQSAGQAQGVLKLTAPTSFGRLHIAPYLASFSDAYPDIMLEIDLSDEFQDIVGSGYDLAIRIGSLPDSGLVARKLAVNRRIFCAAPAYVERFGAPGTIADLKTHRQLAASHAVQWRVEGPDGVVAIRPQSILSTNSSEVVREAVLGGMGVGLRSVWDVSEDIRQGRLIRVLSDYEGAADVGIYAVQPSREFVTEKVRLFVSHLAARYGQPPYWDQGI